MDNLSPDQIKQMITMLQSMLPSDSVNTIEETQQEETPVEENSIIKTVTPKVVKKKNFTNQFDQMMESKLHKADCAIDKKLSQFDPTPRNRNFNALKVQCRVCGKNEEINPVLLTDTPERYKCNRCSRSAG